MEVIFFALCGVEGWRLIRGEVCWFVGWFVGEALWRRGLGAVVGGEKRGWIARVCCQFCEVNIAGHDMNGDCGSFVDYYHRYGLLTLLSLIHREQ